LNDLLLIDHFQDVVAIERPLGGPRVDTGSPIRMLGEHVSNPRLD
jgi:hypothetical protein